jgi:hypothetical protein
MNKVGHTVLVTIHEVHPLPRICSVRRNHKPVLSSLMTYHDVYCKSSITGANSGAGTAYDSDHLSSPTVFSVCNEKLE